MKRQTISMQQLQGTNKYLYQRLDNSFGIPFSKELAVELGMSQFNTWTTGNKGFDNLSEGTVIFNLINDKEIGESIRNLIYYNESDHKINKLIDFINNKRFLPYEIEGERYFMFIPSKYMETPFEYPKELLEEEYTNVQLTHYNIDKDKLEPRMLSTDEVKQLKTGRFEFIDKDEILILDGSLVNEETNIPHRIIINNKTSLNYYSSLLFNCMVAYHKYSIQTDSEEKSTSLEEFLRTISMFRMAINKKVFSKEFKNHYKFNFKGFSGVLLTGNCDIDEVEIPRFVAKKLNLEIGDKTLIYRDPVQNVFVTCTVAGFTDNEIRLNPITILILDGDCDGDKVQVIPVDYIAVQTATYLSVDKVEQLLDELDDIQPSRLLENNSKFELLTNCYK